MTTATPTATTTSTLPVAGGRTTVTPRAMVAIARRAAAEVDGVILVPRSGVRRALADLWPGGGFDGGSAQVGPGATSVELHLAVTWPRPVAEVAATARGHVRTRLEDLTGYRVTAVDIVVHDLPGAGPTGRGPAGRDPAPMSPTGEP